MVRSLINNKYAVNAPLLLARYAVCGASTFAAARRRGTPTRRTLGWLSGWLKVRRRCLAQLSARSTSPLLSLPLHLPRSIHKS